MDQVWLARDVLASLKKPMKAPSSGEYLPNKRCLEIVDSTINHVGRHGTPTEYQYLTSHRRRLAESLAWIPIAAHENAACIDVGCYGYMGFWAHTYLGYSSVEGIEYRSDLPQGITYKELTVGEKTVRLAIHNLDIAEQDWKIDRTYDTVLFFETLEHICTDPVGIITNIGKLMTDKSDLVMSVPNSVSYRTLREFISGTPPWVYWFFHPDLSHEPRHCFEYTPFILKVLLRSAGFEEAAFRTLYAYAEKSWLTAEMTVAQSLCIDSELFGDVILVVARKVFQEPPIRYPYCIYDSEGYYKYIYPLIDPIYRSRVEGFVDHQENPQRLLTENIERLSGANADLKIELAEREQEITNLSENLARLSGANADLKMGLAGREQEITNLTQSMNSKVNEIRLLKTDIKKLEQDLEAVRHRLAEVENSRSWKLTRFYRAAGDALRIGLSEAKGKGSKINGLANEYSSTVSSYSEFTCEIESGEILGTSNLREAFDTLYGDTPIFFPPIDNPKVSVIIPAYRGFTDLVRCLRSLSSTRQTEPSFEVIVVDDCPDEPVLWGLPRSGGLIPVSNEKNLGFLLSCNRGASFARGRILCFLNTDTIVLPGWLSNLVDTLEQTPRAGIAGGMLLNCDGSVQDAGWRILANGWGYSIGRGKNRNNGAYTYRRRVDCVTGACFCIPHKFWLKLKGFDTDYAPAFYEEFDLAFRARKIGLHTIYEPRSKVVHFHSSSYGSVRRDQLSLKHQQLFVSRFRDLIARQPTESHEEFTLRFVGPQLPVILVVDDVLPEADQHAGSVTMTSYLTLLVEIGWRVIFAPSTGKAEGPHAEALEAKGIELIRKPNTLVEWLKENGAHLNWVWINRPEITHPLLPSLRLLTNASIAYYTHDLHHLRLQREAEVKKDPELMLESERIKEIELKIFLNVDRIMTPSREEEKYIRNASPNTNVTTLPPYFYDDTQFISRDESHFTSLTDILFIGGFPHPPNVDAAIFMVRDVMPIVWQKYPDIRLLLVGYAPPAEVQELAGPNVVVTGQVPELNSWIERSRLMLAGLRYGAGVKGKVVEAMRNGLPVVTTTVGVEGIDVIPGTSVIVADDAQGLAEGVLDLLSDTEKCSQMSAQGAKLAASCYSRIAARRVLESIFSTERCWCCSSINIQKPVASNPLSDRIICSDCFAVNKSEALAQLIVQSRSNNGESSLCEYVARHPEMRFHQYGLSGALADSLLGFTNYSASAYYPGFKPEEDGTLGVRCEDIENPTFKDNYFDIIISDNLNLNTHNQELIFQEISRVLKKDGSYFFVVDNTPSGNFRETNSPNYRSRFGQSSPVISKNELRNVINQTGCQLKEHLMQQEYIQSDYPLCVFEVVKL